ncbi:MAG: nucleotidyltransferase domain-containing protein [Anaerolineae bacterium]|nr:nucleotidyltransferase domain-containing protein [Anaerolineae bacterium]
MDREQQLRHALEHIMYTLLQEYQPQKIILFGSMARGEIKEWSDIDLVIVKDTPKHFLARLKEVALLCRAPVGVDYLVYTPREFEQLTQDNPFIQEEVLQKGKVLYEQ